MSASATVHYDPYGEQVCDDPYPIYARMRAEAPVYRNEKRDFWALSRHADISAAFLDSTRFSNANGNSLEPASWGPNAYRWASVLAMDAPRHTRIRGALARFFNPRRPELLAPMVRARVGESLDRALARGHFDFVGEFAETFPIHVLSALIGIPDDDRPDMHALAANVVHRDEGAHDAPIAAIQATLRLMDYFTELVARRRRDGYAGDDLIGHLLREDGPGGAVADDEIVAFLNLLLAAGNDTVVQLLGNCWYWAWRHPDQREMAFRGEISGWIEETLRFDTPNQFAARTAMTDIALHGTVIPAGGRVLLLPGSANRDPAAIDDPDRFDIRRNTYAKRTFGVGRHFCLGAGLARMQATIALTELTRRIADYDIDPAETVRVPSAEARGFVSLPTTVRLN